MLTEEQFCALAKKHMDMIFRIAFDYLKDRNEADDITQNVLLKLLDAKKEFESDEYIKYWLIRVTINESKKDLRSPWRKTEPIEDYASTIAFSAPEHGDVFYALMELPRKYRMALYLFYYEEYSSGEITLWGEKKQQGSLVVDLFDGGGMAWAADGGETVTVSPIGLKIDLDYFGDEYIANAPQKLTLHYPDGSSYTVYDEDTLLYNRMYALQSGSTLTVSFDRIVDVEELSTVEIDGMVFGIAVKTD